MRCKDAPSHAVAADDLCTIQDPMAGGEILPEVGYAFTAGPFHPDNATVVHVHHREAMNTLFECAVILAVPLATSPESAVAAAATLEITRDSLTRRVQGVVRRVEDVGTAGRHRFVRAFVVPHLWKLSQRTDSRIYQNKKTIEIVLDVLERAGIYQGAQSVDGGLFSPAPREYCVQYRETDLSFVSRLLEDEGVPFYFRHEGGGSETLVLCDDAHGYRPAPTLDDGSVQIVDENLANERSETLHWFDVRKEGGTAKVTLRDYDFTRPRAVQDMTPSQGDGPLAVFEYPTRATITNYQKPVYTAHNSARLAKLRLEEHQTREWSCAAEGNVTGFAPGTTVTVSGHVHTEYDQRYLVTGVEHVGHAWTATAEDVSLGPKIMQMLQLLNAEIIDRTEGEVSLPERYRNRSTLARMQGGAASVPFRPARVTPRPIVEGPQTARVVGPRGEEIYVDEHARIKVQFHWDRVGEENEQSSCWVRTAQPWAGSGWGFVFVPRINMEVVVQFLEGDPDRPLVTSCVYNGENRPPYELPKEKTRSALKTNSSPTSGGYNELRFEDKAGAEQVYLQAERNHDVLVKRDQTITVGNDRTKTVSGNEYISVRKNRTGTITENDKLVVNKNQDIEVHGSTGLTVDVDHVYRLEANDKIVLKCGDSTLIMTPQGVWVNGGVVKLNCSDKPSP
jgi:type VI secretion system secreted protein VgrG